MTNKKNNMSKTFRTRDLKTKGTNDTSNLGWHSFRR